MGKAQILVVEDNEIVAKDIQNSLKNLGFDVCASVPSGEEALEEAEGQKPDLVLMDIMLKGEMNGTEAAEQIRSRFDIPVVYLTAYADEEVLERAKETEPFGYIIKPFEERELNIAIELALYKHKMERKLKESEERFRTVADFTYDWEYWIAPDGQYIYVSPSCERITGYSPEEFMNAPGLFEKIVHPDDHSTVVSHIHEDQNLEEVFHIDFRIITRSGEERWINHNCQAVYDADGNYLGRRGSNRDISKRKQMEEELLKIKKFEALGVLAGGIAHQFNNALNSITGYTELFEMDYPQDEKITEYTGPMKQSAHRMAHLTDQLLAYAGGGKYNAQPMSLSKLVEGALPLIQHTLDPDIRLESDLPPDVLNVKVDRTQMQMVLSAILANSNEAVEPPGRIRISTRRTKPLRGSHPIACFIGL